MWLAAPTRFDIWFIARFARFLGTYPVFDRGVQGAIRHNVLGGFWYSAALFALWVQSANLDDDRKVRYRILTTILGTAVAIALTVPAGQVLSWLPPCHNPQLAGLYPSYLGSNPNTNSFPSQSTALYSAVAAGVYSLHKLLGSILWIGVAIAVALPRVFVGGHYPSDILAGWALGITGYLLARYLLEARLVPRIESLVDKSNRLHVLWQMLLFAWILQVALEFRDFVWVKNSVFHFIR